MATAAEARPAQAAYEGADSQGPTFEDNSTTSSDLELSEGDGEGEKEGARCHAALGLCQLCAAVAAGVVGHKKLRAGAATSFKQQLPSVPACSLAVMSAEGRRLRRVVLMEQGTVSNEPLVPGEQVEPETAAWQSFHRQRTLVWTRSGGQVMFADWRLALKLQAAAALVTVPLLYCEPGSQAMGSATLALDAEPSAAELELLEAFGRGVGQQISHQTKHLWEVSLGFLNSLLPRHMVQRVLSAAVASEPVLAAGRLGQQPPGRRGGAAAREEVVAPGTPAAMAGTGGAQQAQQAEQAQQAQRQGGRQASGEAAAAAVMESVPSLGLGVQQGAGGGGSEAGQGAAGGTSTVASVASLSLWAEPQRPGKAGRPASTTSSGSRSSKQGSSPYSSPSSHGGSAGGWSPASGSPSGSGSSQQGGMRGSRRVSPEGSEWGGSSIESAPASLLRFFLPDISLEDVPLQKWTLEFADPRLEESYKLAFNAHQAITDLLVFRSYAVMLVLVAVGLLLRGSISSGILLVCAQVLATVGVPAYLVTHHHGWYVRARSLIVAVTRIATCVTILVHSYHCPELYNDSLLKALCGNCVLSMALNTFRNKLRFTNHLISQLVKLYLCAVFNAFVYCDPARASQQYLGLGQNLLTQLVAVLLPSIGLYRTEARQRRAFVRRRGGMM